MGVFDSKNFNSEVFGKYMETVPRVKQNAFTKAGIFRDRSDIKAIFADQVGGNFATVPMTGRIGGEALNYDGSTNITTTGLDTYLQSMIVVGRMKAWEEKDFTRDITGKDFMQEIAAQVGEYWDDIDQLTILKTLEGIFGTSSAAALPTSHTLDITAATDKNVGDTTLNNAIQAAAGANKNQFTLAIMHSQVATNLENLRLTGYMRGTDANGIERDIAMATWNGRTVMIDDDVPTADGGSGATKYTTYILGAGAFDRVDCGAKTPYETGRDAKTAGGVDYLITRQRKIFAPRGISFVQPTSAIVSPTDAQLATQGRWALATASDGSTKFDHRAIPIARIVSLG